MNEVNPDNAASATPVAWVERTEGGLTRMWSGDLSTWAHRPANPEPLYSAATVAALEAEVADRNAVIECKNIDIRERDRSLHEWAERAKAAERRVAECLRFIDGVRDDLHNRRTADWFPEGAHDAATSMSEDMRLIGNACAEFDPYQDTGARAK